MLFAAEDRTSAPIDQVRGRLNAGFCALARHQKKRRWGRWVECGGLKAVENREKQARKWGEKKKWVEKKRDLGRTGEARGGEP